ncbi:hypothetical protein ACORG1_13315 [Mycobacterium sp. TJFP1]
MTRALLIVAVLAILATSFVSLTLCGILAAIAALAVVGVGLYRYVSEDDDCGYGEAPYGRGHQIDHLVMDEPPSNVIDGPWVPVSRDCILRRDPLAYPLTKRPTWPNEIGAPE